MMKWSVKTETTNIGVLELGNIILDEDQIQISIDICDMSDDLKEEVNRAIETEKVKLSEERRIYIENGISHHPLKRNLVWSDKPVIMDFTSLLVQLEAGKPVKCSIEFGFHDAEDRYLEAWDGSITVDLSAHVQELKKEIIHVLIDKFF